MKSEKGREKPKRVAILSAGLGIQAESIATQGKKEAGFRVLNPSEILKERKKLGSVIDAIYCSSQAT